MYGKLSMWEILYRPIELVAVISGTFSVWYSYKKNILTYFFGLISVILTAYSCFITGIYADMGINVFYFVMSIYGWVNWHRAQRAQTIFSARSLSTEQTIYWIVSTVLFWSVIGIILNEFTDSIVVVVDSFTTALCITGMILMAFRFAANWLYFLIADLVSIPLYWYKELYFYSFFFIILSIFAILGYQSWRESIQNNK